MSTKLNKGVASVDPASNLSGMSSLLQRSRQSSGLPVWKRTSGINFTVQQLFQSAKLFDKQKYVLVLIKCSSFLLQLLHFGWWNWSRSAKIVMENSQSATHADNP